MIKLYYKYIRTVDISHIYINCWHISWFSYHQYQWPPSLSFCPFPHIFYIVLLSFPFSLIFLQPLFSSFLLLGFYCYFPFLLFLQLLFPLILLPPCSYLPHFWNLIWKEQSIKAKSIAEYLQPSNHISVNITILSIFMKILMVTI